MPRKKTFKVPLSTEPVLSHRDGELIAAPGSLQHRARKNDPRVEWVDRFTFKARMVMDDGLVTRPGRSSKIVYWRAEDGRRFPMFMAEVIRALKTGGIQPGGVAEGSWETVKRGQNFGVKWLGVEIERPDHVPKNQVGCYACNGGPCPGIGCVPHNAILRDEVTFGDPDNRSDFINRPRQDGIGRF